MVNGRQAPPYRKKTQQSSSLSGRFRSEGYEWDMDTIVCIVLQQNFSTEHFDCTKTWLRILVLLQQKARVALPSPNQA